MPITLQQYYESDCGGGKICSPPRGDDRAMEVDRARDGSYTNELISIISRCQRMSHSSNNDDDDNDKSAEPDDSLQYPPAENSNTKTHVIIYNFLALSTVLEQSRDVGAVAVYQHPNGVRVYYSKNQLNDRCQRHVAQLAELIRAAAKDRRADRKETTYAYFNLMLSNASNKFKCRLHKFKDQVRRPLADFGFKVAQDVVDYLKDRALSDLSVAPVNHADAEAAAHSPTKNVYEGLAVVLETLIQKSLHTSETLEYCVNMSLGCYMFGHSSLSIAIANQHPQLLPLVEAAQKFGEYIRGVTRLLTVITQNKQARERYSRFEVIAIPSPQPVTISLYPDWFDVLRKVYLKRKGQEITVTKSQFRGVYGGINNYEKYLRTEFVQHAEITLLTHLAPSHTPAIIGISKACCGLCYQYITALNRHNKTQTQGQWIIGGKHENVYNWLYSLSDNSPSQSQLNAAIDGVREWVENQIVQMIEHCQYRSGTESPTQLSDNEPKTPEFSGWAEGFWDS